MNGKCLWFIILVMLGLLCCVATASSQVDDLGQIAFVSSRDGSNEIYVMNADGTELKNLTNHPASDTNPAWSPDGSQLAFVSNRIGSAQVYVMNPDGSDVRQLTDSENGAGHPVWSPDGTKLAFTSSVFTTEEVGLEIQWMNSDGSGLVNVFSGSGYGGRVSWSPDGQQLLFDVNPGPEVGFDLFVVNLDGSELHTIAAAQYQGGPLSGKPSWEVTPVWSPNSDLIAFGSDRFQGRLDVFVANSDSSNVRNLTRDINYAFGPLWAPDGQRLAFMSAGEGLYVARVSDGRLTKVTEQSYQGVDPEWSWSPDSAFLALTAPAPEDSEQAQRDIYIVARDGSSITNLTNHVARDWAPAWQPAPPSSEENLQCGTWARREPVAAKDARINSISVFAETEPPCRASFRLKNETDWLNLGGYTFGLTTQTQDASFSWHPTLAPTDLLAPVLDLEMEMLPLDPGVAAHVAIRGEMTLSGVAVDTSLFLLRAGLALAPPGTNCLVDEEALLFTAVRVSSIVSTSAELALQLRFNAAYHELLQIGAHFYEESAAVLASIGFDCAADVLLEEVARKVYVVARIVVDYIAWVPNVIWDYWEHQGQSANVVLIYSPPESSMVTRTEVIFFEPTGYSGEEAWGSCWTGSIAFPRQGVWRCMVGNSIHDPCFSSSSFPDAVICHPSPFNDSGFKLNLTEPLPDDSHYLPNAVWIFELEDGALCYPGATGTNPYGVTGRNIWRDCDDGTQIEGDPQPGEVWTAERVRVNLTTGQVEELGEVAIRRVWR